MLELFIECGLSVLIWAITLVMICVWIGIYVYLSYKVYQLLMWLWPHMVGHFVRVWERLVKH